MIVTLFIRSAILLYVALHTKSVQLERKSTLDLLRYYKNEVLNPKVENSAVSDQKDMIANKKLTNVECSTNEQFIQQQLNSELMKVSEENFLLKFVEPNASFFFSSTYFHYNLVKSCSCKTSVFAAEYLVKTAS